MLEESDKEQDKELERKAKKAAKKVNQLRTSMGAGKCQPGIGDMFKAAGVKTNPSIIVQESRVVTRKDKATRSNGPSNVFPVITGQSNRSSSNVPVMECC